jgi:hypothetical protein
MLFINITDGNLKTDYPDTGNLIFPQVFPSTVISTLFLICEDLSSSLNPVTDYPGRDFYDFPQFLTPWSRFLLERLTVRSSIQEILHLLWNAKGPLPCSQQSTTGLYPEPVDFNPHPPILFPYDKS